MICVDTNILVFSTVSAAPQHAAATMAIDKARTTGELVVTAQIIREYIAATTHPRFAPRPLDLEVALADVTIFLNKMRLLDESSESLRIFRQLIDRHRIVGRAVHDANIAATMLANGVTRILTDNVTDFRRYAPEIEIVGLA